MIYHRHMNLIYLILNVYMHMYTFVYTACIYNNNFEGVCMTFNHFYVLK